MYSTDFFPNIPIKCVKSLQTLPGPEYLYRIGWMVSWPPLIPISVWTFDNKQAVGYTALLKSFNEQFGTWAPLLKAHLTTTVQGKTSNRPRNTIKHSLLENANKWIPAVVNIYIALESILRCFVVVVCSLPWAMSIWDISH